MEAAELQECPSPTAPHCSCTERRDRSVSAPLGHICTELPAPCECEQIANTQRRPLSHREGIWFQSICALVLGITWRSLGLLAGPAALFQQVSNGYEIRFSQFIMTT
ncbi:unnamed protein product [Tetraodon nigroviridis]|uniref:(spotted green pufferfish) hypothetical protein n=1 Tax=Tetraodon nigroviridis TaxID=99883 RepID=Q4RRD2_TETNG|nr:unnamed protein product [Tetraodon nigroviridis]